MSEDENRKLTPTVMPERRAEAKPARVKPPDGGQAKPATIAPAGPLRPTMVMGTSPVRLTVTEDDLRRLSPGAGRPVLDAALVQLGSVMAGKMTERKAILWGHDLQRAYADSVSRALALAEAPTILRMQGHVVRLLDIIESFDLGTIAQPGGQGVGSLFKVFNRKVDTMQELETARGELDQLVRLMSGGLDELLRLREEFQANARAQEAMAISIEAAALSALYLSEHFNAEEAIAGRFVERAMSLTQTLAQIRGDDSLRTAQVDRPIRMIAAIQNVTLVSVPDLLTALANLGSLRTDRSVTPTEASEIGFKLRHITGQLQP